MLAEEQWNSARKDISRQILEQFDNHHVSWENAIKCLAVLDVLLALTAFAADQKVSRPRIVPPGSDQRPFSCWIKDAILPIPSCSLTMSSYNVSIGPLLPCGSDRDVEADHSFTLVTGPNMGGKSTLMRQVELCVILAQMGSSVPAEEFELPPIDWLFTCLGANEHILGGEIIFFVELSETAAIPKHATLHSLVLLDELCRGTATFHRTAIAYSVVDYLARRQCRTLFSTHYYRLVYDLTFHPQVRLGHMACMVENDEELDDPSQENIIFLCQLWMKLALNRKGFTLLAWQVWSEVLSIISRGFQQAKLTESRMLSVQLFRDLFQKQTPLPVDFQPNWSCLV